jgi:very-short-patch-repair endonuclease
MDCKSAQSWGAAAWALAADQHGVIARRQLLALGMGRQAITHRIKRGRLHRTRWRSVYAVGRPQLRRRGVLMAAVLAGGPEAVLSHPSAAELWAIRPHESCPIELSIPADRTCRRGGLVAHRRMLAPGCVTNHDGIPVTTPVQTLIDLATCLSPHELEAAINAADRLELVDPEQLRAAIDEGQGQRGVAVLRELLDRSTFTLTDSQLERMFLALARRAGLPPPLTQQWINDFRVDFYWPDLGLVVETDGLRYHRTPHQQTVDRRRDQAHTAAGLTALRFSHAQVRYEAGHVQEVLASTARRLKRRAIG